MHKTTSDTGQQASRTVTAERGNKRGESCDCPSTCLAATSRQRLREKESKRSTVLSPSEGDRNQSSPSPDVQCRTKEGGERQRHLRKSPRHLGWSVFLQGKMPPGQEKEPLESNRPTRPERVHIATSTGGENSPNTRHSAVLEGYCLRSEAKSAPKFALDPP